MVDLTHMAPSKRSNGWLGQIVVEVVVNIVAPFLVYTRFDASLGDVKALLLSSAPPICWSLFEFARSRRIDAVSLLVLAGIALSLVAFIGGGSVRWLQLRENLVTGLIGLIFLGSAVVRKPIIYQLARAGMARRSPANVEAFEQLRKNERFRRTMSLMTLVWGFGLLAQTAIACILVFAMPISEYLIVGPIVSYAGFGALAAWTFWFVRRQRRGREAAESTSA
jgi:hypothetical protein